MFRQSGLDGAVIWPSTDRVYVFFQYIDSINARELDTKQKKPVNRLYKSFLGPVTTGYNN